MREHIKEIRTSILFKTFFNDVTENPVLWKSIKHVAVYRRANEMELRENTHLLSDVDFLRSHFSTEMNHDILTNILIIFSIHFISRLNLALQNEWIKRK